MAAFAHNTGDPLRMRQQWQTVGHATLDVDSRAIGVCTIMLENQCGHARPLLVVWLTTLGWPVARRKGNLPLRSAWLTTADQTAGKLRETIDDTRSRSNLCAVFWPAALTMLMFVSLPRPLMQFSLRYGTRNWADRGRFGFQPLNGLLCRLRLFAVPST